MPGFGVDLGEGEAGTQRRGGTCDGRTPPGLTETWVNTKGSKWGSAPSQETMADADRRCGAQGREAETGGWRMRATSRWEAIHTGIGGGEQVKTKEL